ncbi:MAG: dimethyl sulfoxide reductase anchor subunit [Opitutaceae bacterium]|nr:dimethyl sulfoxide reductase anchor subunit [Opitutaceae bacterium]
MHRDRADTSHFLPTAPDPEYTQPTTRYVSVRGIPSHIHAADAGALRVQPAHWPLAVMLTLTQLAVGLLATAPLIVLSLSERSAPLPSGLWDHVNSLLIAAGSLPLSRLVTYYVANSSLHAAQLAGLALLFAGLGSSTLHLGQPLRAWRFFLGLRTSWLSREILIFSAFAPLALASLLLPACLALRLALVATGVLGIACSAMIYIDTRRCFWAASPTCIRFFGTALVAALATVDPVAAALVLLAKLGCESTQAHGSSVPARLQRGPLRPLFTARFLLGVTAAALLAGGPLWPALALFAAGELAERLLFFRAVDAPKMPGNPSP